MARRNVEDLVKKFTGIDLRALDEAYTNFDSDFTGLGKSIGEVNKLLSDMNWRARLGEIDAAYQSGLVDKNAKLLELARKMNVIYADFSKEYWNAVHKDDANDKLPPNQKFNQMSGDGKNSQNGGSVNDIPDTGTTGQE